MRLIHQLFSFFGASVFTVQEKDFRLLFFRTRESLKAWGKAIRGYYLCCRGINLAVECKMNLRGVQEWGWKVETRISVKRLMLQSRHKATKVQ